MKHDEFDLFTVEQIKKMMGDRYESALDVLADSYVVLYKIQNDINNLRQDINSKNIELQQSIDLCMKCLKLVETTIQNRK